MGFFPFLLQRQKGEWIMQKYIACSTDGKNEYRTQKIAGACSACETDQRIVNVTFRIVAAARAVEARGTGYPAGITRRDVRNAISEAYAAMDRIVQRHLGPIYQ